MTTQLGRDRRGDLRAAVPEDPLAPVRSALLARAHADAAALLAQADDDVAAEVAQARRRADTVRADAAARGTAEAEAVMRSEMTRARREARTVLLRARRQARDRLRSEVGQRLAELRDDPAYPRIRARLEARARDSLGADAVVEEDPSGGLVARAGSRRVVYSFAALADQVLEDLGAELEGLWQVDPSTAEAQGRGRT